MLKKVALVVIALGLALSGLVVSGAPAQARQDGAVVVLAVESAEDPVTAWAAAYGDANDVTFDLQFVGSQDDVLTGAGEADFLFYPDLEALPDAMECGAVSHVYVPLPELGARYVARSACEGEYADPAVLKDFARFIVSPDGQQIAIDLDLLPDVVTVEDQGGVTVEVPQPVRRIVSAYGVSTYYTYTLAAGDRLVAASYVGVRGPAAQDAMRRVDPNFDTVFNALSALSQTEINLEELAEIQPDLLLASARTQWLDGAAELGVPIIRFEGETPERLKESMTLMGAVLGPNAAHQAEMFNAYYDRVLAEILAQTQDIEDLPRVYFSGTEALRVASGEMYQTSMVEAAGGVSVSGELTGFWNDVNLEQVVLWEPDVIFVPTYGGANVEAFTESEEWAIVPAVEAGNVYQLPSFISPWDTPLPDSILGIMWMAERLHPEQVELACATEAVYFYNTFYNYPMTEEEAQGLCG